jgi:CDP-diacylglycerol---serine O-phosphatidyltransferase
MLRHRRSRRLRPKPLLHLIPNMFTILGLCLGLTGLRYAIDGRFEAAVTFVLLAGMIDGLDGRSARLLGSTSRLGAELDSLVDFVNFGVVPAVVVYLWSLEGLRGIGWPAAIVFATCCALRLARFNSELDEADRPKWRLHFFTGIPAPAAAGLAVMPLMASFVLAGDWPRSPLLNVPLLMFVAFMMVSRVPTFSLKRVRVPPDYVLPLLTLAAVVLMFLITETWLTLTVAGMAYLASIPASWISARRMQRREALLAAEEIATEALADEPTALGDAPPAERPASPGERVVTFEGRPPRA